MVLAIDLANAERAAMGRSNIGPGISSDFSGESKDYTRAPDSETYFADLVESGCVDNLSWSIFAGAGVPAAADVDQFMQGVFNAVTNRNAKILRAKVAPRR